MVMDIEKLDLEYQYAMLAHHVAEFLGAVVDFNTHGDGLYQVVDDDLEHMRERLAAIRRIQMRPQREGEAFAREPGETEEVYFPTLKGCDE